MAGDEEGASWKMRTGILRYVGVVFVLFGIFSAWGAVGTIQMNPEERYSKRLEIHRAAGCMQGEFHAADGRWYCERWTPEDIKFASVPLWLRNTRVTAGNICAVVAFVFAVSMSICGVLWLCGWRIPDKSRWWHILACGAAPVVAWCLPVLSTDQ